MYTVNIIKAIKKKSVKDARDFIFQNYYKRIEFSKESSYCSVKRLKRKDLLLLTSMLKGKVPDPCNAKEHYESFLEKKNRKSLKQSKIIPHQPKTFDTVDVKSNMAGHPKTSHKLSKTIIQAEKVSSNSPLYSDTKKRENFLNKKNMKITKR